MAAGKRHRVAAALIVVKVPGAQGGEVYLHRGRRIPATVDAREVKRLQILGLIEEESEPDPEPEQDPGQSQK